MGNRIATREEFNEACRRALYEKYLEDLREEQPGLPRVAEYAEKAKARGSLEMIDALITYTKEQAEGARAALKAGR